MSIPNRRGAETLFSDTAVRRIGGALWGAVFPPKRPPPLPVEDARHEALEALGDYIAEIVFQVPVPPGGRTKPFRIERDRIYVEWPDAPQDKVFPSVEFIPGAAEIDHHGFTPFALESSIDLFGPGTVLVPQYEHRERVTIEVSATTRAQRRLLLAGIEAMLLPSEDLGELRLITGHYRQPARFVLVEHQNVDDADSARRRRRANLVVEMSVDVVRLVNVARMRPAAEVGVQAP